MPDQHLQARWMDGEGRERLFNVVVRAIDGERLSLAVRYDPADSARPETGQDIRLQVAKDIGLIVIPTKVVGENLGGTVLFVAATGAIRRLQRRQYVRVQVDISPSTAFLLGDDNEPVGRFAFRLIGLSGGGVLFECFEPLGRGDRVQLVLRLDNEEPLTPIVEVVDSADDHLVQTHDGEAIKFSTRGFFTAIHERERQRIVQYVFRQQALERRRRILAE